MIRIKLTRTSGRTCGLVDEFFLVVKSDSGVGNVKIKRKRVSIEKEHIMEVVCSGPSMDEEVLKLWLIV